MAEDLADDVDAAVDEPLAVGPPAHAEVEVASDLPLHQCLVRADGVVGEVASVDGPREEGVGVEVVPLDEVVACLESG